MFEGVKKFLSNAKENTWDKLGHPKKDAAALGVTLGGGALIIAGLVLGLSGVGLPVLIIGAIVAGLGAAATVGLGADEVRHVVKHRKDGSEGRDIERAKAGRTMHRQENKFMSNLLKEEGDRGHVRVKPSDHSKWERCNRKGSYHDVANEQRGRAYDEAAKAVHLPKADRRERSFLERHLTDKFSASYPSRQ